MHCGFTGLLGVAAGSLLVASEVFGISVWDTSHMVLLGDEQSPGLMTGITGHQESLWFCSGSFCMSLYQVFPLQRISHLDVMQLHLSSTP